MILITGASGQIGRATIEQLSQHDIALRAMVRSAAKTAAFNHYRGVEPVIADLADPHSLDTALRGVSRALLVSPLDPDQVTLQGNFIDAARRAGEIHIVKISGLGTALDSPLRSGRWHAQIEQQLENSGLLYTHLRPLYFMQNLLRYAPAVAVHGEITAAMQQAGVAMVDVHDIAAVAATVLTNDGHAGKRYTLTGPETLSFSRVAEILSNVTGRPVTYRDMALATLRRQLQQTAMPGWHIDVLLEFSSVLREYYAADVSDAVFQITGTPARTFEQFARAHVDLFRNTQS
jgi:uncharacterized protein YbjT (DUF2867 family)